MNRKGNPTKNCEDTPQLRQALRQACEVAGLDAAGARLIHHYANAVYLLPAEGAVVRLQHGPHGLQRAATSFHVTRSLIADHGFPATAPLSGTEVVAVDETTVGTFWTYYRQPDDGAKPTPAQLGTVIRRLHSLPAPPVELPRWRPLRSLEASVRARSALAAIDSEEQRWLLDRIERVRQQLEDLDWPLGWGVIHGDAWVGNLLWDMAAGPSAAVLADWDSVSWGPREVDLIPSFHAARRYGRGHAWAQSFVDAYGYDLSDWEGFRTLLAMRDLVQIAGPLRRAPEEPALARALRQRLAGIRSGSTTTWTEF